MKAVIYGCGENGLQAYHCLKHYPAVEVVGFLDGNPARHGQEYLGKPVLGDFECVEGLRSAGVEGAIVAIGDNRVRARISARIRGLGLRLIKAIHPAALIDSPRTIGDGVIIEMGAAVHPEAEVGAGVFVGGGAIVAHHSIVGDFALIGGGVIFGGAVKVGAYTLIGVGTSIKPHVMVGANVTVGVGAAVVSDLPDNVIAVGVPARIIGRNEGAGR